MRATSWESFESRVESRESRAGIDDCVVLALDSRLSALDSLMHIFLYEWATGGGLVEEPGPLPASLVREGAAMIGALAADLVRIEGCRVTALRDPRVLQLGSAGLRGRRRVEQMVAWRGDSSGSRRRRMRRFSSRRNSTASCSKRRSASWRRRPTAVAVAGIHSHRGQQAADVRDVGGGGRAGAGRAWCWNRKNRCRPISRIRPC